MNAPYAAIICRNNPSCGNVDIDEREYEHQMDYPNRGWCCPRCGGYADFDDTRFEEIQGISGDGHASDD